MSYWIQQSQRGALYQNEVKCSAFVIEMIFHSHANKTRFHKKGCALGLILKVRVFGTRKWPITCSYSFKYCNTRGTTIDFLVYFRKSLKRRKWMCLFEVKRLIWSALEIEFFKLYSLQPVLGGHPVLRGHLAFLRGWPLNTSSTVLLT